MYQYTLPSMIEGNAYEEALANAEAANSEFMKEISHARGQTDKALSTSKHKNSKPQQRKKNKSSIESISSIDASIDDTSSSIINTKRCSSSKSEEWKSLVRRKTGHVDAKNASSLKKLNIIDKYDFSWLENTAKDEHWWLPASEIDVGSICGQGCFGVVRKAEWRGLEVVAKTFLDYSEEKKNDGQQGKVDLGKEISILSSLKHPNLVMFFGKSSLCLA